MKRVAIRLDTILHLTILIVLMCLFPVLSNLGSQRHWDSIVAIISIIVCVIQVLSLRRRGYGVYSFELWFLLLSYLFMLSRIILSGAFGVHEIFALNYERYIYDQRFSNEELCISSVYAMVSIEAAFAGMLMNNKRDIPVAVCNPSQSDTRLYNTGKLLLFIGTPCFILDKAFMIVAALRGGYGNIASITGLADDFANFMLYGVICVIMSNCISQKAVKKMAFVVILAFVLTMMLTGDRRYEVVGILTLLIILYMNNDAKLSAAKKILLAITMVLFFNLLYVLRETRYYSTVSFVTVFFKAGSIVELIKQTAYEFGASIYSLASVFKTYPSVFSYRYGATIITALLSVVPIGFLYQSSVVYTFGRISDYSNNLVGGTYGATVFGDMYGNFGVLVGILLTAVLGCILSRICNSINDSKTINYNKTRYYICFYSLLSLPRASFTEVTRTLVWGLASLLIAYNISKNVRK